MPNRTGRQERGADRCPKNTETQTHVPDLYSIARDDDAGVMVLDVACRHCGRSGSFILDPADIQW